MIAAYVVISLVPASLCVERSFAFHDTAMAERKSLPAWGQKVIEEKHDTYIPIFTRYIWRDRGTMAVTRTKRKRLCRLTIRSSKTHEALGMMAFECTVMHITVLLLQALANISAVPGLLLKQSRRSATPSFVPSLLSTLTALESQRLGLFKSRVTERMTHLGCSDLILCLVADGFD